jgi:hypothetical protein
MDSRSIVSDRYLKESEGREYGAAAKFSRARERRIIPVPLREHSLSREMICKIVGGALEACCGISINTIYGRSSLRTKMGFKRSTINNVLHPRMILQRDVHKFRNRNLVTAA